jgi:hypothetical protein
MADDTVEKIIPVREVVAVFSDARSLEDAIEGLQSAGTHRAAINVMSSKDAVDQKLGHHFRPVPGSPEPQAVGDGVAVTRYEMAEGMGALISIPIYIGATAGLIAIFATGGGLLAAAAVGLVGGTVGGGFGALAARALGQQHAEHLETQLENGGLLLWVHVTDDADEAAKIALLRSLGGQHVQGHTYEKEWGVDEVPLHDVQPDPFLTTD